MAINSTVSGVSGNPYENINTSVGIEGINSASKEGISNIGSSIANLNTIGGKTVDTSITPNTSLSQSISDIRGIASRGITSGDVSKISSLRPTNQFESDVSGSIASLKDYSQGNSKVDQTIANRYLTKFDASSAASTMAQSQKIANNPYLTTGAKTAAMQELNRSTASARSDLTGSLAEKAQERAYEATKQYATSSLAAAQYKEDQFKTDLATASTEVKNNLDAAISAGSLSATEVSNNIAVWNTQVSTKLADLNRELQAATAAGELTSTQATMRINAALESAKIEQNNITNDLTKAKGILEWQAQQKQNEVSDAQIEQANVAIAAAQAENYKTWNTLATSTILDYRTKNQGTEGDDWESASQDPAVRAYVKNVWNNIPGNEGVEMDDAWAESYYKGISTAAETTKATTEAKLNTLKQTWVGTGEGQMSQESFDKIANVMRMTADFGGTVSVSADGTSVSIIGSDGKPMKDSNGNEYSWNTSTGSRTTTTKSSEGSIEDFNTWKTDALLGSDTSTYSEEKLFNAYKTLVSKGTTEPTRDQILAEMKSSGVTEIPTETDYTSLTDKIAASGANAGTLAIPSSTNGKLSTMSINPSDVNKIVAYEKANPDKANYTVSGEFMDTVTVPTSQHDNNSQDSQTIEANMMSNIGKIITLNGKQVVPLGIVQDAKNNVYNRKWNFYNVETGKVDTKSMGDVITEANIANPESSSWTDLDYTGSIVEKNVSSGNVTKDDISRLLSDSRYGILKIAYNNADTAHKKLILDNITNSTLKDKIQGK